jgi:hypothetical protein
MPKVQLPDDFINATKNMTVVGSAGNGVPYVLGLNGKDQASMYVGVVFDGYQNFNNFTSSLPQIDITFVQAPTIIKLGKILDYDPDDSYIDIPVSTDANIISYRLCRVGRPILF